jgi:hypothetical protein
LDNTSTATQASIIGSDFIGNCRSLLVSTALMVPQLGQILFRNIMQHHITIDPKSSTIIGTSSNKGLIQTGHFLPNTTTLRKGILPNRPNKQRRIERYSIRELLVGNGKYTAIFIGTCHAKMLPNLNLMEKFWIDTRIYPIRRLIIQSAWHSHNAKIYPKYVLEQEKMIAEESFYCEERIDLSNSITNRAGLLPLLNSSRRKQTPSVLIIVRPDLYIAHAKIIENNDDLDHALKFFSVTFSSISNQ